MKGKLHKTDNGWVVRHPAYVPPHEYELPLHPHQDPNYEFGRDMNGEEVEFDVEEFWETGIVAPFNVAKLIMKKSEEESPFSFICTIPDCPHCAEDRRQMEEDDEDDMNNIMCPRCGETTNLHYNYDWSDPNDTIYSDILCNECGEYFSKPSDVSEDEVEHHNVIGKPLDDYIREKHNQDRCMGFIDGYKKCKETYKFTEEDMIDFTMTMIAQYVVGNTNIWNRDLLRETLQLKNK